MQGTRKLTITWALKFHYFPETLEKSWSIICTPHRPGLQALVGPEHTLRIIYCILIDRLTFPFPGNGTNQPTNKTGGERQECCRLKTEILPGIGELDRIDRQADSGTSRVSDISCQLQVDNSEVRQLQQNHHHHCTDKQRLETQGSSQEFIKEYTEGTAGVRGLGPGKFLIFEVTQPYFL